MTNDETVVRDMKMTNDVRSVFHPYVRLKVREWSRFSFSDFVQKT
jgi:hypothetical protein